MLTANCDICNPNYTPDFILGLQDQVDRKLAKNANVLLSSEKNDLGIKINQAVYFKLVDYKEILERILHCNQCFEAYKIEDIVSLVKTNLHKI